MDSSRRITVSHKTMCCMKHGTELKLVGDVALYRALEIGNGDAYAAAFSLEGNFAEAKGATKRPPMHHVITNSYLQLIDKDDARLEAY